MDDYWLEFQRKQRFKQELALFQIFCQKIGRIMNAVKNPWRNRLMPESHGSTNIIQCTYCFVPLSRDTADSKFGHIACQSCATEKRNTVSSWRGKGSWGKKPGYIADGSTIEDTQRLMEDGGTHE